MNQHLNRPPQVSMALMLLALLAAELTSTFEVGMLLSALSKMYGTFNDPVGVGWLITSFLMVGAASTALCGRLGDMLGRARVMLVLLGCAAIGSLISAQASSLEWIIVGRAVQGMSAAVTALCIGLVREHLPPARVALGVGIVTATATVGVGLGMVLGGVIVDHLSWPWLFYCSAALALLSLLLVSAFIPLTPGSGYSRDVDILGGILFAPAVAGILYALSKARSWGWWDGRTLGWLGGCMLLLVLWTLYELRHKNPLINVRLFAQRQVALTNLAMVLVALGWIGMTAYHNAIPLIVAMLLLITFGGAMMYAAMPNLLIEAVPSARTSEAIGVLHVMRTTFTAVGAQLAAFTLASSTVADTARGPGSYPAASAYSLTFFIIALSALLTVLVTLALPRRARSVAAAAGIVRTAGSQT